MTVTAPLLPALCGLDWDDLPAVAEACRTSFEALIDDRWAVLARLLRRLPDSPRLSEMCETYDFLDKLVVHDDARHGYRVRLHRFRPGHFDRPHHHRWSFGSMILTGAYRHVHYGSDDGFEDATSGSLRPLQVRTERAGDWYVLHHTAVHSVAATPGTLSLVLRGPAAKSRFRIIDTTGGSSFHVRGAQDESAEERAAKRMPPDRLTATVHGILAARPHRPTPGRTP